MTIEEAITTLKEMHESFDEIHENTNGDIGYEQMTALDMAIEALSVANLKEKFESVEVVRCKDCKWRKINRKSGTLNCGHEYGMITAEDDNFCNYGEKEDE